jgi:hypothetical protein
MPRHADARNDGEEHDHEHHRAALPVAFPPLRGAAVDRHLGNLGAWT